VEYLVNMTTHVPDRTSDDDVETMRTREAAHSRGLAAQGHLLRLWRPPLLQGEWRTLGLFAAENDVELEKVLASMPLRVWRTDDATPLSPHPNDPAADNSSPLPPPTGGAEFLTTFTTAVPDGTPPDRVRVTLTDEDRTRALAEQGHLERLWVLPAERADSRALGLWRAHDGEEMETILRLLPMDLWMTVQTTPLSQHPNDPANHPEPTTHEG
jgi:muconolactone delta-isomerase